MNGNYENKNKLKAPELLAPAGNAEALVAAVQSGADAVYLGLSSFNARASAENFTEDNLRQWVDYAHLRGVKVHVTLNTLVKTNELDNALSAALAADKAGADAFIVQDLGLAARLAGRVRAALHASTQATVYNEQGLKTMKALGFDRAVLARELPLNEIKRLSETGIMETEAFCHGALCISYSGQCMLSRFTTGRSGNRGTCAQPCRLKYSHDNKNGRDLKNLLSPADLCSLSYLSDLIGTGVSSLKIEGRLKSPEYVAAVTRAYRKIIDNPASFTQQDIDELAVVFSRGGFCSGHQLGKMPLSAITKDEAGKTGLLAGNAVSKARTVKGPVSLFEIDVKAIKPLYKGDGITFVASPDNNAAEKCDSKAGGVINVIRKNGEKADYVSAGETASLLIAGNAPAFFANEKNNVFYKTYDEKLYSELKKYSAPDASLRKVPLGGVLSLKAGEQATFTLTDPEGRSVTASSEAIADRAEGGRGISAAAAREKLSGFGGTPFFLESFSLESQGDVFISFSELKALRRKATELITAKRIEVSR